MIVGHKDEVDQKRRKMPKISQVNKIIVLDGDLICYSVGGWSLTRGVPGRWCPHGIYVAYHLMPKFRGQAQLLFSALLLLGKGSGGEYCNYQCG